eukprot:354917-Chlamydomonas_euryale.AAC.27
MMLGMVGVDIFVRALPGDAAEPLHAIARPRHMIPLSYWSPHPHAAQASRPASSVIVTPFTLKLP